METLQNPSSIVNHISIDWLSFTTHDPSYIRNPTLVGSFLGVPGKPKPCNPLFGYKKSFYVGLVRVLFDGTDAMGVHVIISGEALRTHFPDSIGLIKRLYRSGQVSFSRIDIAFDDFTGSLNIPRIVQALRDGNVVSNARKWSFLENGTIGEGPSECVGEGVMIGKRDSESCLRFYNKTLQQKTMENAENLDIPPVWVRMELELKRGKANDFVNKLTDDYGTLEPLFLDVINDLVRFVVPGQDKLKQRWQKVSWWSKIINSEFPCKLSAPVVIPCIVKTVKWFQRSVASSMVLLWKVCGQEYFEKMIDAHEFDHSQEHLKLMKQIYVAWKNEKQLNMEPVAGFCC